MTRELNLSLVRLHREMFPVFPTGSRELEDFFGSDIMKPALGLRKAVMLLRKLNVCNRVCADIQATAHVTRPTALRMLLRCITRVDLYDRMIPFIEDEILRRAQGINLDA